MCVLLDDCLSAVDSHTANHIFFHAIKGPLMQGRTCILATHNTRLAIPHCDYVVVLNSGRVKGQGPAKELAATGLIGADILEGKTEAPPITLHDKVFTTTLKHDSDASSDIPSRSPLSLETEPLYNDLQVEEPVIKPDYKESKPEGAVPWSVIYAYLLAMGSGWYWILVVLGFAAQQLASLGTN